MITISTTKIHLSKLGMTTEQLSDKEKELLSDLPKINWRPNVSLHQFKGYWLLPELFNSVMAIQSTFKPCPSDTIISSFPKTGTTWLKALTVSILNHNNSTDPLQTHNPHELVPMLELEIYGNETSGKNKMDNMSSPRVYNTHLPLSLLPVESIMNIGCRVIYIARNPMDTIVSCWHFFNKMYGSEASLEKACGDFCNGTLPGGPYFEHVLEHFNMREKENVFFITYEELKEDPNKHVKRLADFLGRSSLHSNEVEEIVWRSSHDRLSKLDVNQHKEKVHFTGIEYGSFFRRGIVGDYKNHLTPSMIQRIDTITKQKLEGSGLQFKLQNMNYD